MGLVLHTAPAVEPLDINALREHLRVDHTLEDTIITSYGVAARQWAEAFTNRQFITATYILTLDAFPPSHIALPRPPAQTVSTINYIDTAGTSQLLDPALYTLDSSAIVGRVAPIYGEWWPSTRGDMESVTIEYKAGYGDSGLSVPESILLAIRLLTTHFYENRLAGSAGIERNMQFSVEAMLWPYRVCEV